MPRGTVLKPKTDVDSVATQVIAELKSHANPANVAGMARYGISSAGTLGVSVPLLRSIAKRLGHDHRLALRLWNTGIHEARILAPMVDDPALAGDRQMERWVRDLDSWDVCDGLCHNLLRYTPAAFDKATEWADARAEFVRRAGFALMAGLAVKARQASDSQFEAFLPLIAAAASDDRNLVKKAVNWALRQIGKRNRRLHAKAIRTAEAIRCQGSRSARWIAADALRELRGPVVARRLGLSTVLPEPRS
ncbi:MAG: DNA alkylation repair protein [Bryobacteraceae bacterium]|jgi:3-methyladenine DNA glycosylase AlkD